MAKNEGLHFYRYEGNGNHYEELGATVSVSENIDISGKEVQFLKVGTEVVYMNLGGVQHSMTVDVEGKYLVSHEPQTTNEG